MNSLTFKIWDSSSPDSLAEWKASLAAWPNNEVYADPYYVQLYEDGSSVATCAYFESDEGTVLFPFLLRRIPTKAGLESEKWFDIITPYGYGGPVYWNSSDSTRLARIFWSLFDEWAGCSNIVSEFIRFSLFSESVLPYPGTTEYKQDNVVRSLDLPEEDMWMDFEHKVRKNVNKANRSGLEVVPDLNAERFDDFFRIYVGTMDRRDANAGYYFPREYFDTIHRELHGKYAYFHALLEGEVVSTELVLLSSNSAYSFLGGTSSEAFSLRPNDLLKFEIMKWCRSSGRTSFVLGGGFEPDDGIFRYKLAFAPSGRMPFNVGSRVHDAEKCKWLVDSRKISEPDWRPVEGFFPQYRS